MVEKHKDKKKDSFLVDKNFVYSLKFYRKFKKKSVIMV